MHLLKIVYLTSEHMQRIENWWNWVWQKWAYYYKGLFQDMERDGFLDRCRLALLPSRCVWLFMADAVNDTAVA